jgi:hypothetical protein
LAARIVSVIPILIVGSRRIAGVLGAIGITAVGIIGVLVVVVAGIAIGAGVVVVARIRSWSGVVARIVAVGRAIVVRFGIAVCVRRAVES